MKRPSFQFYPGDWRANAKLRRCSFAERGIWIDFMCLLHDSEEYGVLRWPLKDIAQALGCRTGDLQALRTKGVLKGADAGETCAAFVYTPRHARQEGEPVILLAEQPGPVWYSSRMVLDDHRNRNRGAGTRFTPEQQPSRAVGAAPKPSPDRREGDGPSSSSSSSEKDKSKALSGAALPDGVDKSESIEAKARRTAALEALAHLNARAGTKFRPLETNLGFAIARLREGATLEDLVAVVDAKVAEASAGAFDRKYLRPETLWNATKFGSYVGQIGAKPPAAEAVTIVSVLGKSSSDAAEISLVAFNARGKIDAFQIAKNVLERSGPIIRSKFPNGDCRHLVVAWNDQRQVFSLAELRERAVA